MAASKNSSMGDCYEAAASHVLDVDRAAMLVHGQPTLAVEPFGAYGHAWVEFDGPHGIPMVREVANGKDLVLPAALYYLAGQIDPSECYRYDHAETRQMLVDYAHWGPWEGPEGCPPVSEEADDD